MHTSNLSPDEIRIVKKLNLFGLEQKMRVRKSGNSLVITLPPAIARFVGISKDSVVRLLPCGHRKLEVEVID